VAVVYIILGLIGLLALLAAVPTVMAWTLDPLNSRLIRKYCESFSLTDIEIKAFPNHYGVHFIKDGQKLYAKCSVVGRKIKWKGPSPDELLATRTRIS
jgi:hypothetical protein